VRSTSTFFVMLTALLMLAVSTGSVAAGSGPDGPIIVVAVQGDVRVSARGSARTVRPGSVIETPATINTGRDGRIELRQGATTVSVASNTHVDLPAVIAADGLIEHVSQPKGNVLYDVAKRPGRKLRIETPYLVAVVKGTRFNVAAEAESATVALFEGRLEVWTPDDSDVVQLNAGEIATRARGDRSIRVLDMDTGDAIRARSDSRSESDDSRSADAARTEPATDALAPIGTEDENSSRTTSGGATLAGGAVTNRVGVPAVSLDPKAAGTDIDATFKLGHVPAGLHVPAAMDIGAAVDLGAPAVDAGVAAGIEVGTLAVPVAADAGVAIGGSTAVDAGVALGPIGVDVGVGVGADSSAPAVDLDVAALPPVVEDVVAPLPVVVDQVVPPLSPMVEEVVAPLRGLLGP
jgi:FecR protein